MVMALIFLVMEIVILDNIDMENLGVEVSIDGFLELFMKASLLKERKKVKEDGRRSRR